MQNFDEIRPYNDDEVPAAIQRVISNVYFPWLVNTLSPEKNLNDVNNLFENKKRSPIPRTNYVLRF
jgi:hypothetical protein